ncbi:hypothetical protein like AT5G16360 [Hibiscus trionum]|uniref:LRAT domain-containing protein n=1 Tax=Hibiscus trionum TaxID=183268 RepID=A0A9W7M047_HIBTR|nr:hypothetical protein like AT5G16360 [Hibiscus trionum]
MGDLEPGDHIFADRGRYDHHGIYVGEATAINPDNGKTRKLRNGVIHFGGNNSNIKGKASDSPCRKCFNNHDDPGVTLTCMKCFLKGGDTVYTYYYGVSFITFNTSWNGSCTTASCDEPGVVIKRAYGFLRNKNFGDYDFVFNNCEHFATAYKTGKARCNQAALGMGVAGAIVYKAARRVGS